MAEADSLSNFDFNKVRKPGKFLKFEAGKPVTVRILTKDPVIQEAEFENKKTGEKTISTKFCFVVWNFTDEKAQIMSVGPGMAEKFKNIAVDEDFGANLQKCDIKISPEGEQLNRVYDVNVLRHSGNEKELTNDQINEAREINLDEDVQDNRGRLSEWEPPTTSTPGYDAAKAKAAELKGDDDIEGEPINLDDIPF